MKMKNPIQPLANDALGILRFKENSIVTHLYEWAEKRGLGMNELARMDFTEDDRQQFAQLIGYSLCGYGDLSYVSDDDYGAAAKMADEMSAELDKALIEAGRNEAEYAYFKARPQIDCNDRRKVFEAGYDRGLDGHNREAKALAAKARKLEAENKRLRKALEPMIKGLFWLGVADVRRAYKALGKECPLNGKVAETVSAGCGDCSSDKTESINGD